MMGMHTKTVKNKKYLYHTEMKDGKKVEKYCGSVDDPMSKMRALAYERAVIEERQQRDREQLESIMQQLKPIVA